MKSTYYILAWFARYIIAYRLQEQSMNIARQSAMRDSPPRKIGHARRPLSARANSAPDWRLQFDPAGAAMLPTARKLAFSDVPVVDLGPAWSGDAGERRA